MKLSSKISVGIVDDHWAIQFGLISFINSLPDFEVTFSAFNGENLIEQYHSGLPLPQIFIIDMRMVGMDGIATTEWLYKNHPEIKVIGMSASFPANSKNIMLKNGCIGFLNKDDDCDTFRKALVDVANKGFMSNCTVSLVEVIQHHIKLTEKELECLVLFCSSLSNMQIGVKMNLGVKSVERYSTRLHKIFNVHSRHELINAAMDYGFVHQKMMEEVE